MADSHVISFFGYVPDHETASNLFELARNGYIRLLHRRLTTDEQQAIVAGHGYIYDERNSEIKRWSDGRSWTDSSSRGEFLLYKECEIVEANAFSAAGKRRGKTEKINGLRKKAIADKFPDSALRMVFYYDESTSRAPLYIVNPQGSLYPLPVNDTNQTSPQTAAVHQGLYSPPTTIDSLSPASPFSDVTSGSQFTPSPPHSLPYGFNDDFNYSLVAPNIPTTQPPPTPAKRKRNDDVQYDNATTYASQSAAPVLQPFPSNQTHVDPLVIHMDDASKPIMEVRYPEGTSYVYLDAFNQLRVEQTGVNADFAEYMAAVPDEAPLMKDGHVVNFRNGVLTTQGFEGTVVPRIISTAPLILGNDHGQKNGPNQVKIAMVGQVPILTWGAVQPGDFIVAGRKFDDVTAVPESMMTTELYGRVVGIALEGSSCTRKQQKPIQSLVFYPDVSWLVTSLHEKATSQAASLKAVQDELRELKQRIQRGSVAYSSGTTPPTVRRTPKSSDNHAVEHPSKLQQYIKTNRRLLIIAFIILLLALIILAVTLAVVLSNNASSADIQGTPTPTSDGVPTSAPTGTIGPQFPTFRGSQYAFRSSFASYADAVLQCQQEGWQIAVVPPSFLSEFLTFVANNTEIPGQPGTFSSSWVSYDCEANEFCAGAVAQGLSLTCRTCTDPYHYICRVP